MMANLVGDALLGLVLLYLSVTEAFVAKGNVAFAATTRNVCSVSFTRHAVGAAIPPLAAADETVSVL